MFYRNEDVDSALLCSICSETFREGDPRLLPCGEWACNECIQRLTNSQNEFNCSLCHQKHRSTSQDGLPVVNGTDQVKEYCIELRNQVHLQTDILLEQVHQFNEAVIAEIDEYEKKCVDSYQQKSVRYQTANKKFLTKLKKFYNENSQYLTEFKIDEQKIQDGLVQTDKCRLSN
jgi:hypothetical protein